MDEAQLKARYDREIGAPDKELLWEWLKVDNYVSEVCQDGARWSYFKARAQRLAEWQRKLLRRTKPPGRTRQDLSADDLVVGVELTNLEAEHAKALAPYLAKRAGRLTEVNAFREKNLDGGTLRPEQVPGYLRDALKCFSSEDYPDLEWSLGQVPSYLDDSDEELKDLIGGWLNRSREAVYRHHTENVRRAMQFDSMAMSYEPFREFEHGVMHLIGDGTGGTLEDLGRWLAARYPWPLRDAAWFVITDEPPEVEPLRLRYGDGGRYEIVFAPWISEKTMRHAYRSLHHSDNRPLGRKNLTAFCFVDEHTEVGCTPEWAELTRRWNARNPEARYWDGSALKKAYERAEMRLASPWADERHRAGGHAG